MYRVDSVKHEGDIGDDVKRFDADKLFRTLVHKVAKDLHFFVTHRCWCDNVRENMELTFTIK